MLLSSAVLVVTVCLSPQSPPLVWKPAAGDTCTYKLKATAKLRPGAGAAEARAVMTTTHVVREVRDDGKVIVEETQTYEYLSIDGVEVAAATTPDVAFSVLSTFDWDGRLLAVKTAIPDLAQPRMAEAMAILYPGKTMKAGEKWTYARPGDQAAGTVACETIYRYERVELSHRWQCHRVGIEFREKEGAKPMSCTGTVWLSVEKGEWVRAIFDLKNVEVPGVGTADVSLALTRSD